MGFATMYIQDCLAKTIQDLYRIARRSRKPLKLDRFGGIYIEFVDKSRLVYNTKENKLEAQ